MERFFILSSARRCSLLDEDSEFVERLAFDVGDGAVVGWVSDWDHHVGAFMLWTIEEIAEELHW